MVCHHYSGIVPANTTTQAPFWEKMKIGKGTIIQWVVFMPEECADLLKFWIEYHGTQIFPFNPEAWAYGFFTPTTIPDEIELPDEPFTLDFFAVNLDDQHEHEYSVYVSIKSAKPIIAGQPTDTSIFARFRDLFGG
jgi:hypothetical protein